MEEHASPAGPSPERVETSQTLPARPGPIPAAAAALGLQRAIGNRNFAALAGGSRATRRSLQRDWSEPEWEVPWWLSPAGWAGRGIINHFSSEIDIAVVDANDVTGWLSSAVRGRAVEVDSIPDMVTKVLARLNPGQRIRRLYIDAHGSPGALYVGSGSGTAAASQLLTTSTLSSHSANLGRWTGRFSSSAVVTIGGCQVAANADGVALLSQLTALWRVPVRAGSDYQRPLIPGLEGPVTRCAPAASGSGPVSCATE
jgi:Domain of unknown function (DUF4347)